MSTASPSRPPAEQPSDTGDRVIFWIIGGVVLLQCIIALFTFSAGQQNEQADHREDHDERADRAVHPALQALRAGLAGRDRDGSGHDVISASGCFQLGFCSLRNNHGGISPSPTVPARISPT